MQVSTSGGASVVAGEGSTEKPSSTKNLDARSWKIKKPADLAVDRQGAIYVAEENGNVYKVNDGKVNRIADGLGGAVQLAVDADGVLYVADNANDTVYKYTGYNQRTKIVGGRTAADMMFGPDGNLYLADRSRNRIEKIENGNWSWSVTPTNPARWPSTRSAACSGSRTSPASTSSVAAGSGSVSTAMRPCPEW